MGKAKEGRFKDNGCIILNQCLSEKSVGEKKHKKIDDSVSHYTFCVIENVEKGLLNDDVQLDGMTYTVSDVFFSHWMERL